MQLRERKGTIPPRVNYTLFFSLIILLLHTALPVLQVAATNSSSSSLSGCQVCYSTGNCSHAYLDGPGKFCGNWLDQFNHRQRCCCPMEATCKVLNYACKCSNADSSSSSNTHMSMYGWIGLALGVAVFLSCCIGTCWFGCLMLKKANQPPPPPAYAVTTAVPVPVGTIPPYSIAPAYVTASAPPIYHYGYDESYSSGGGGFSSAITTVAGLATGMFIADAIFDHGHDGFNGGGFDGGGDFGGDF